jgi:DNA-binding transcriptional regulator PaaX
MTRASEDNPSWLLLAYRVPGEPARLRATLSRRLKRAGAVYLAHSVAVLPDSPSGERLLRRLRSQVRDMGGTAQVLRAEALAGHDDVIGQFDAARDREYAQVIAACGDLLTDIKSRMIDGRCTLAELNQSDKEFQKLTSRNAKVRAVDGYGASQAEQAEAGLAKCQEALDDFGACVYRAAEAEA